MSRRMLVITVLILILAGCLPPSAAVTTFTPAVTAGLPDTWTPGPTAAPSLTPTAGLSPSPTLPLPTEATPTAGIIPPSATVGPRATPRALLPGAELTLTRIQMFTPQRGWGIGIQEDPICRVLTTDDGGRSWKDRTPPAAFFDLDSIYEGDTAAYFWDQNTAWVLFNHELSGESYGTHTVWRTSDGGASWTPSSPLPFHLETRYIAPAQFYFISPQQGWLWVHEDYSMMHDFGDLFQTRDGGQTWILINSPGDSMIESLWNTEMAFANAREGWMLKDSLGGIDPFIEVTRDGGATWAKVALPALEGDWYAVDRRCAGYAPTFFPDGEGIFLLNCFPYSVALGTYDLGAAASYLYRSPDLRGSWEMQEFPSRVGQLVFLDEEVGFALGRDHYLTRDGGATWEKIKTVNWDGQFSFISPLEAWAVARGGDEIALVHTGDGGETYQIIRPVVKE
jgi:photosystem II stability/assembly factor-like uncharacterized protein